jgi:nucleoside-diphosphate-sugar epimerase
MKVLLLGGTGSIGTAVLLALRLRGHAVLALARSARAQQAVAALGAQALPGDLRQPEAWIAALDGVDAVIHAAGDFEADAAAVGARLLAAVLGRLATPARAVPASYLHTGGCWLYGATGDRIATEDTPLQPPAAWAWSAAQIDQVRRAPGLRGLVIHPAMVYERDGGVLAMFRDDLQTGGRIRVYGSEAVRWPMVHRADIGALYVLALERGTAGACYNGAAVDSVPVGALARAMARRAGKEPAPLVRPVAEAVARWGDWARGYALDQRMSGERTGRELGWQPRHRDPIADLA